MKYTLDDLKFWGIKSPEKFIEHINRYSQEFKINTPTRILCFWANVLHESANLFYMREISSGVQYEGRKAGVNNVVNIGRAGLRALL